MTNQLAGEFGDTTRAEAKARDDARVRTERLAARGSHPDDGERPTEAWDYGL